MTENRKPGPAFPEKNPNGNKFINAVRPRIEGFKTVYNLIDISVVDEGGLQSMRPDIKLLYNKQFGLSGEVKKQEMNVAEISTPVAQTIFVSWTGYDKTGVTDFASYLIQLVNQFGGENLEPIYYEAVEVKVSRNSFLRYLQGRQDAADARTTYTGILYVLFE